MATASSRARGWHLFALVAVLAAAAIPIGLAGATDDANTIHACVRSADGVVRIVSGSTTCRNGESATQWNQTGPAGPSGPAGEPGPAGPAGPAGPGGGTALGDPEISYLTCTGIKQGVIEGDSTLESHPKWMEVVAYSHAVTTSTDPASGQATGKRQHLPLRFTKKIDRASPRLMQALVTGEALSTCKFELVTASGESVVTRFRIELEGVRVAGIEQKLALPHADTPTASPELEEVSFTFHKITWTWTDGGITTSDSWTTQT